MNYGGNMPDWHQYNPSQPIGSEVPPVGQNANHSPIFGSNISPRRLNGPTFSPEGLNKPQNDVNFNPRNFQQSPNTLNGPNVPPDNSPMGSAAQMSGCHGPYRALSPRTTMIEGTGTSLDSRSIASSSMNEAIGQQNHQISMNRPAAHLNCSSMNGSMGPMGQRSTPTSLQAQIPASTRQGPGSYIPCKLACCNPDTNIGYQSWEKFGPYPPNVPYRDTSYPVDNRRFGNEFENREQLGAGAYNIDARRNFPDYKYRKDTIIPRPYPPPGVIQNYPIQNYNFPADYQKYPAYPIKEYPRETSIANPQNPGLLKYQEHSVIVQQKYFTKQVQYQNGVIPKSMGPTSMGSNVISRAQNPYFNPQLARDFPQSYSDSTPLGNRGIQTTNPIHAAYPKYQMYQQKIAMQRFSMENHLRELTRIPGYQSHPKYQESVLRYRELLRLQQTVDYQSTVQDQTNVATSQVNDEIPPINLQFDQNGVLINTSFATSGFSNLQSPINLQSSKNLQRVNNTEVGPLNLQYSEQFKTQTSIDNRVQDQESSPLSQTELPHKNEQHYSIEKDQSHAQKHEGESLNVPNSDNGKIPSMDQRNSKDFADKPELDVRQFLANWDESEDEDGANANLPDVVLSNSTSGVVPDYENTNVVSDNPEESENCSETEDCRGRDGCEIFENTQNETEPSNSTDNKIYQGDLLPGDERTKYVEHDLDVSDSGKKPVRTGTVIQPTSAECDNEISLHIMKNLANSQADHDSVKFLRHETESLNNNESQELLDTTKDDIIVKKESIEEESITSIKEHIRAYNHEANTDIPSNIEDIIENDDDSRSSYGEESSENTKHHFDSDDDLSESCESDSMDSHSISSYTKSPKTIKGTEIHVDAQELSAIPVPPKSNSETLDSTNMQKQNSFVSEESHNPDDISLPDLPTSECTPISTTLNTPIHSDSEESSDPVIELTTPANPIEIIQNSPMLSFTHSPIKMEPYEHLDENDLTDKVSHDALDFEFQGGNSCDNDCDRLTDISSQGTEQYDISQNDEDTFDSDRVEILSEKSDRKIEDNTREPETKNDVIDNITDHNRFGFHKGNVMTTDKANTIVNADHQPWSSITVRERRHQISNNTEYQDAKSDMDKFETSSEMKDTLSVPPEVTKDHLKDDTSSAKNYHSTSKWQTKCEMENVESESTDNMTALNLVKDENKVKPDSIKMTDGTANAEVFPKAGKNCPSSTNEGVGHRNSSMENEELFNTSTKRAVGYTSSSEEDKIYAENIENQSNFTGSLNIPLIPGEYFEEPKMPVLPMEGNCLTKIIKNTSPITDLDVLGSDDEKLDKMDEIWSEVGGVETDDKVTDATVDSYAGFGNTSDREKSLSSKNKPRMVQKYGWKCLKNSVKPKDPNKLLGKVYDESQEIDLRNNWHLHKSSNLETTRKYSEPINEESSAIISGTDTTTTVLQEKHNFIKVPTISRVTSNNYLREYSKQSHDICLENNSTEVLKCKEKGNHINDIATKLLENARLFEPELRKTEVQRRESSCDENTRDGSKKRIKLLKEFRKVKNKINTDRSETQSIEPADAVENNVVSSTKVTEQCGKVDVEKMKVDDKTMKNQNDSTGTIENIPKISIENSINNLGCEVIQKINVNAEENTSHAISMDIQMPDEKLKDRKATLEDEHTTRDSCSIVNPENNITVEGSSSINAPNSFDTKAASPIDKDINECAINLSKSSFDLGLVETLNEESCPTNDSRNFYTSDHMEIEEPTEIASKTNEETTCTETKDDRPILSQPSYPEDSGLCTNLDEEDNKTPEVNHVELENDEEDNCESRSALTCMNSAENCILNEATNEKIDEESTRTVDHEDREDFLSDPEKVEDVATPCSHAEDTVDNTDENCMNTVTQAFKTDEPRMDEMASKQNEHPKSNGLVAVEDKEEEKPVEKTVDSEITWNADDVWNNEGTTSTENKKESLKLIDSFDGSEKQFLTNHSAEKVISVESIDDLSQKISSEEKVFESVENEIGTISVPCQERNTGESTDRYQLMESEPILDNDCPMKTKKSLQALDTTTDIHTESKTMHDDPEIIRKPSIMDEFNMEKQLEECTTTECLQNTSLELVSPTDKNSSAIDATLEAFGLENSFNCDFSDFDVAPNVPDTIDTDQSNNWKYSKAHARFEDCERYKNPDNFTNPILTSLDTLDNLNTVPVYTTKDGKITYSPNPKFTYRALIMEAREREGYPALRESYYGNPRHQESFNYTKNQTSFRKRKSSDTYNYYGGSYGKKNYSECYEPREHGESSTKNSPEPWSRSYFGHNKYSHQSRDRNSHHFTSYNNDAEKKCTADKIAKEQASTKYKNREGCAIFDEFKIRKNGTSVSSKGNNKKQYKQSTEQSASDSSWSGSKRNLICDQESSKIAPSRSETNKLTNDKKNSNLDRTIKDDNRWHQKNGNRSTDFKRMEKFFTSVSDENKHATKSSANMSTTKSELNLSSDIILVENKFTESRVENLESSFHKTENTPSNHQDLLQIMSHEANEAATIKPGFFCSECEDSFEKLAIQQTSSCELETPAEILTEEIEEVCDQKTKVNKLYDEVDDIHQTKTSDISEERFDATDLSGNRSGTPSYSVQSPIRNERVEDPTCDQEKLTTDKHESTINNTENEDASYSIPVELIQSDKDTDEQKIPEIPETQDKSEPEATLNERAEGTCEEDRVELRHCGDRKLSLNCIGNRSSEVEEVNDEELVKDTIPVDKQIEFGSLNQLDEVQDNLAAQNSNAQVLHSLEDLRSATEIDEIERKELAIKSHKIKLDHKNETLLTDLQTQASGNDLSHKFIPEYENTSKPQLKCENYIAYSPSDESPEANKAIPKIVIKKTDSLSCRNVCLGQSSATSHNAFAEKVSDKEEQGSKVSVYPKIPKILIRNAKSRPSTPSIEEITEEESFSVPTKEESKVPKVKIRFEEKKSRSPTVSSNENVSKTDAVETKIPKMKIKLEDRLPKVIMEMTNTESCRSNEGVQKTVPKMKIKKCRGTLGQIVDAKILPVSIPRMLIYTEFENGEEATQKTLAKKEVCTSDKNSKSVTLTSIQEDQKTGKDTDVKKIPKLKIKRQSSGCSVEMNRKRHSVSPTQSELKKVKKSLKLAEPNEKKQFNKLSTGLDNHDSLKKLDTFSFEQSYELAGSENIKYTAAAVQSSKSVGGEQTKSTGGNISETPEEIPKVIIKRASPSAEFKCELSKVRRDAIIKNKRWQPEVKLQRSWVLDCMAKDLNLDKLRLKVATPDSILKKCLLQQKPELGETHVKNGSVNTNRSDKKLFRSKSTSELVPAHGSSETIAKDDIKQLNEENSTGSAREWATPKRCKSDLGSPFSKFSENLVCRKKLRYNNHSSTMQLTSKPAFKNTNEFANSSNIQSGKEDANIVKHRSVKDLKTNSNFNEIRSNNEPVNLIKTSEGSRDETLAENMNVEKDICLRRINKLIPDNPSSNSEILFTNAMNISKSSYECYENSSEITKILTNNLKTDGTNELNDSHLRYSATECRDEFDVSKDSVIVKNTSVDSVKRHTKSGKKQSKETRNHATEKDKTVEIKSDEPSSIINMSTNYIEGEKTREISSIASHDKIDCSKINTEVPAKSVICQAPISTKPDTSILENNSKILSSDVINTADNLQSINCGNNLHKLDVDDNTNNNVRKVDDYNAVSDNSISYMNIVEQEITSTLNEKVLITSVMNKSKSIDSDAKDVQESKIDINLNISADNAIESDDYSLKKVKYCEESERIIEILSASPSHSQSEVEIQLCPDGIEENGICLYHEDAIPTQFELELEIIDNTVPDPLEVPMPHNDHPIEEFRIYSGDEQNKDDHQSNRISNDSEDSINLDDFKSETKLSEENNSQVSSIITNQREVFAYPDKQDAILSGDVDERKTTSNARTKTTIGFNSNVQKSFSCADLLVEEVLAAKERLRKCLAKSKNESRYKVKARPKTAAEKKQGSSFDLNTIASCEEISTKSESQTSTNFIAEGNTSKEIDQNLSTAINNEKFYQNRTKTEFKVNKIRSERKHSKGSKNNLLQKKYSSFPKNIEKYTNLTQVEGYLIPKNSSIDNKDRFEFSKKETTISLKNSKYLIKNHSYPDARKKTPELINSKDSKCRSKSSRHDVNSKYVGKSKSSALPDTVVQEHSLDLGQFEEKPVSEAAKHNKYKSTKTSVDQNVNSMTEKAKFKLYKIPKIAKPINTENERLIEELRESQTKEARMPILEPQVDLNGDLEVSELSADRESSRSPPVITNQERGADYEATTDSSGCPVSANEEKEVLSRKRTTSIEKEIPEAMASYGKETTVADIVNDMAYHEKATIRHRRYCTLCERWFPTVARYRRHLSGYQHRHTELTQRRTIHALFTLFTGRPCPRLQPPGEVRIDCEPGELTPLQIAVQGVTKESNKVDGNIEKPTREDK